MRSALSHIAAAGKHAHWAAGKTSGLKSSAGWSAPYMGSEKAVGSHRDGFRSRRGQAGSAEMSSERSAATPYTPTRSSAFDVPSWTTGSAMLTRPVAFRSSWAAFSTTVFCLAESLSHWDALKAEAS